MKSLDYLVVILSSIGNGGKKSTGFEFLTGKGMRSKGGYDKILPLGQCMIKTNRSNPKICHAIPIAGCPPSLENMVNTLRKNGVEIGIEDYHSYRKHLVERYKSKPQFDPKDFFE